MSVKLTLPADALLVLCGPAACGKSVFARRRFLETEVVSSDRCRAMVADDEDSQWASGRAFEVFHYIIRHRLALGRFTVADSTALEKRSRAELLALAREAERAAHLLVFDVSPDTCLQRDSTRPRQVGRAVVERHCRSLEAVKRNAASEGFDGVAIVTEDEMDDLTVERVIGTRRPACG